MLLFSCAKQVVPGGGDKDETPPQPVRINPPNFSTNFYPRTITIEFDEFIDLKDPTTQVFLSPTTSQKPVVKLRNKSIVVTMPDTMKVNTTYSLYFGNAIRDITEANVLNNFQYVFSTGSYIDSLRLQGLVVNSLDNKRYANALVMLRTANDDSAIVKQRPDYFVRADEDGAFRIDYLRPDKYYVTALDDANSNFKYDPTEAVAFYDSVVNVVDTSRFITLHMFRAEPLENRMLSARASGNGRVAVAFAKGVTDLQAALEQPVQSDLQYTYNLYRDSLTVHTPKINADTALLRLRDAGMDTLVRLRLPPVSTRDTVRRKGGAAFEVSTNLVRAREDMILPYAHPLRIFFSAPIRDFDSSRFKLVTVLDSTKALPVRFSIGLDTMTHRNFIQVDFAFVAETMYRLELDDSLSQDAQRSFSRKQRVEFRYGDPEESGNVLIHLKGLDSTVQYIALLRSTQHAFEQRWIVTGKEADVRANNLVPGQYNLFLITDANRNRRRDSGNYWEHRQPEKSITHTGGITVRANWDLEVTLNAAQTSNSKSSGDGKGLNKKKGE